MNEIKDQSKGWKICKISEVCEVITGTTPSKAETANYGYDIPFFKPPHLWDGVIFETEEMLSVLGASRARIVPPNTVLVTCIGNLGRTGFVKIKAAFNQQINAILENDEVNGKYIFYQAQSPDFKRQLEKLATGTTVSIVNKRNFETISIPIPPLPEQLAIVSKIEELFSELDKGKEQLQTALRQLKIYRQSLLKWAFEGKLTNDNVKVGELPEGWKWIRSGELFSFVTSGSRGWAKYYSDNGSIFIRITNMDFDTLVLNLNEDKIQYVNPPNNSEGMRTKVQEGDFLFSITGYLGMFAIAPKLENAFVNQHVCLCRPKDGFNKKFVGYWIISKSGGNHHLNKNQKGAVKAGLNLDDLKNFPVPLCSLREQELIVEELESKLTICDKIEETLTQSLAQAETLRQSILKRAFEGKLVTNY